MPDLNITVDGKKVTAPAGTLLIEACKSVGIEVPSFCYYPNLSLQGACRMCLVKIEKIPKLQTACTTVISEGMIVTTESDEIRQARKSMVELLLGNHPLDCPVCDAGGECELQDMTFSYGAAESKYIELKQHRDEQQRADGQPREDAQERVVDPRPCQVAAERNCEVGHRLGSESLMGRQRRRRHCDAYPQYGSGCSEGDQ